MKIAGVIAEYNPLHSGHVYQLEKTRENGATHIVAAMSGSFVQRGEVAIFDKWTRAKAALSGGVDLVVEIPAVFAVSSANRFARAGVFILHELGADMLSFGSECGDVEALKKAATATACVELDSKMATLLGSGISYPRAIYEMIKEGFSSDIAEIVKSPNNILAIEYINAIKGIVPSMVPFAVKRAFTLHDSDVAIDEFASASYIRELILRGRDYSRYMPKTAYEACLSGISKGYSPVLMSRLEGAILYRLRTMSKGEFAAISDVSEGLENRLFEAAQNSTTLEEFYMEVKTKRYTLARIRRIAMSALLGITATDCEGLPQYIRVLAANKKGIEILKMAKGKSNIIISPKAADLRDTLQKENPRGYAMLQRDFSATDIAMLGATEIKRCGADLFHKTIIEL